MGVDTPTLFCSVPPSLSLTQYIAEMVLVFYIHGFEYIHYSLLPRALYLSLTHTQYMAEMILALYTHGYIYINFLCLMRSFSHRHYTQYCLYTLDHVYILIYIYRPCPSRPWSRWSSHSTYTDLDTYTLSRSLILAHTDTQTHTRTVHD